MQFKLVVGDWSGDGHEYTSEFQIYVPDGTKKEDIIKAYGDGVEIIGVDIQKYCDDYEDNRMPIDQAKKILEYFNGDDDMKNALIEYIDSNELGDGFFTVNDVVYVDLFVITVNTGNPDLFVHVLDQESDETINIGGYGLFQ